MALTRSELWHRAQKLIPGGVNSPVRAMRSVGLDEPFFVARGHGATVETADGRTLVPQWSSVSALPDRQSLKLSVRFPLARRPGLVTVTTALFPYDPAHQTFLNVYEGDALTQAILDRGRPGFE